MQLSLAELSGKNPAEKQILRDLGFKSTDSAENHRAPGGINEPDFTATPTAKRYKL
jgi:hypothetical protein